MTRTACVLLLTILASGLSLADPLRNAPAKPTSLTNPYEHDFDAIRAGGKLFRYHCAECHGGDANGSRFAPTLRSSSVQGAEPGALFWFLTNGDLKRGMPSWSRLPEQRRWQLVSYLKVLGDNTSVLTNMIQGPIFLLRFANANVRIDDGTRSSGSQTPCLDQCPQRHREH